MVFHTAPPQPASNALCTCAPELAGGAEASQKGLGERMPAKLMLRSGMGLGFNSSVARAIQGLRHTTAEGVGFAALEAGDPKTKDVKRSHFLEISYIVTVS